MDLFLERSGPFRVPWVSTGLWHFSLVPPQSDEELKRNDEKPFLVLLCTKIIFTRKEPLG